MSVVSEMEVLVDLNEKGDRIMVTFGYDPELVRKAKAVNGYRFLKQPSPHWLYPLDLMTSRALRDSFGEQMTLGSRFRTWAKSEVERERNLSSLATAMDAELPNVEKINPSFAKWLHPYQRAAARIMAIKNVINADQPGLGKTVQTIAAIMERGEDHLYGGGHLIVAPKTSLDTVWEKELEKWVGEPLDFPVMVLSGDDSVEVRNELLEMAVEFTAEQQPFFLVLNPAFVTYTRNKEAEKVFVKGHWEYPLVSRYPELFEIPWKTRVFDEYHKMGITNTKTNTFKAVQDMSADVTYLLSGTPMGGKPIKLWSALHLLEPQAFTSMWRWAARWLEIEENEYGKSIHGLKKGMEDAFYRELQPHMIRRLKKDVAPQLPKKQFVDIWYEMTPKQQKQYDSMAANAEIKIEEEHLSATGILAEYTRLKQFANAHHKIEKIKRPTKEDELVLLPTQESGMLPHIEQLLEDRGITGEQREVQDSDEQVVIASQFSAMINMLYDWLTAKGIGCARITGAISQKERTEMTEAFQRGEIRVMLLTTTAGGVAITLDKANTLIICDETWDPDDQEQVSDRIHRLSRIHQVTIYTLRAKNSIESYIQGVVEGKSDINQAILDARKQGKKLALEAA